MCVEQKEELENMRKQHDLLKKMLEQQEQLRALQGRQAALLAMQQSAEQAIAVMDDNGEGNMFMFLEVRIISVLLTLYMYYSCYRDNWKCVWKEHNLRAQ